MQSVDDILNAVGPTQFAREVDTTPANVSHMRRKGQFPARMALRIRAVCERYELERPGDELFSYFPVE